jgi:hypothetical protein
VVPWIMIAVIVLFGLGCTVYNYRKYNNSGWRMVRPRKVDLNNGQAPELAPREDHRNCGTKLLDKL